MRSAKKKVPVAKKGEKSSFKSFLYTLRKKRIIEILAGFIGGGWLILEFVHWILIDHYHFPEESLDIALVTLICALICTLTWRIFAGVKKRARKVKLELILIPLIILITAFFDVRLIQQIGEPEAEVITQSRWKNSIAVLPFKNMSADPEQEYFCEGLAEELINALTHIKDLRVVARTSAFSFKGEKIDIREVGQKLNADKVLEGSVRKAGNRLRITAQLINVSDGYHLWSERYDRNMEDIFAIQDEISLAIVDKLKVKLLKGEKSKIIKRSTDNIEAYNLYLKGRFFWNKRTEDGLKKSVENFEKAIEKDPGFALAYAGLADSISTQGFYDFILPRKDAFSIAREHALKALELDATVGETHAAMANIKAWCDYDWEGAEQEYKKALKLNPSDAEAHHMYSHLLSGLGRFDEALFEMRRALALEPLSVNFNNCLGIIFFTARRYDEAIEQFRVSIELDPSFSLQHYWLGRAYLEKRMNKQAIETLNKATKFPEIHTMALSALGYSYAVIGKRDKAQDVLNKLKDLYKKKYVDPFHKALPYIGLGENELALAYLKQAYEEGSLYNVYLSTDPIFDSLRDDSRFIALLKKMGFAW